MRELYGAILGKTACHCEEPRSGDVAIFIPNNENKKIPTVTSFLRNDRGKE